MGRIITVPTRGKEPIDFSRDEALHTADLEACVAVGGTQGDKGALMHLTQVCPIDEAFDWFYDLIPVEGSQIYLVGGITGKSERFVKDLRRRLSERGYTPPKEKVLTEFYIDMWLRRDRADLSYKRLIKSPSGFDFIPFGENTL